MAKVSPFKFMQEVRQEASKITWPSRRETAITTVMVFIMGALAALFFTATDWIIRMAVALLLGIGT
jgi:preprotein translocase subunit SecE